jgi:hypothetical protein
MSKLRAVVRTTREPSQDMCLFNLEKNGIDYYVINNLSSLEEKSKETIKLGIDNKAEWLMTVDADVFIEITRKEIEQYCEEMKKLYDDEIFVFTGYLDCTKRGFISGLHFFRTKYCKQVYNLIKDMDFSWHQGREEMEICREVEKQFGLKHIQGYKRVSFGVHNFEINKKDNEI